MSCNYSTTKWLPKIQKKILYLDQFFFSNAFKKHDMEFSAAAEKILSVSAMQLIAVPFSSIHEDETHQWRGYDGKNRNDLMEFIKATSRGHRFEPSYNIERIQTVRAFQKFLGESPSDFELQQRDAIPSNIHEWDDYFRIDVGNYIKDVDVMRDLKEQSVEMLLKALPNWRQSKNTFEQDLAIELRAAAQNYVDEYLKYMARISSGDFAACVDSPIIARIIPELLQLIPDESLPEEKIHKIDAFFKSDHFSEIPYQWLSVRILAVLKDKVKQGSYTNLNKAHKALNGFFHDMQHVSIYGPYCDAIILDKPMAALVSDRRIDLEGRFGIKVFSKNNLDDFLSWLEALENYMTQEHRAGLSVAYP